MVHSNRPETQSLRRTPQIIRRESGIDVRGYAAILVPEVVRDLADADFGLCHPDSSGMPENVGRDAFQPGILRGRS